MKIKDRKTLAIVDLRLPGDWRGMVATGAGPEEHDVPTLVYKSKGNYTVVCGWNAVIRAAAMGRHEIEVLTVGDVQAQQEQAFRELEESGQYEMLRKLIGSMPQPKERRLRKRAPRQVGPETMAPVLGITPEQYLNAEKEARKREGATLDPIYSFGLPMAPEWLDYVGHIRAAMADAYASLAACSRAVADLDEYSIRRFSYIKNQIRGLADTLNELRPVSVCPSCKNQPGAVDQCACCEKEGWVGTIDTSALDARLLADEPLYLQRHGQLEQLYREDVVARFEDEPDEEPTPEPDPIDEPEEKEVAEWDAVLG